MTRQTSAEINACRDKAMELLAQIQAQQPANREELQRCLTVVEFMAAALLINVHPASLHEPMADDIAKRVKHWLAAVKAQSAPQGRPQ